VLPDQSVFVSCYCATEAELEKARDSTYVRTLGSAVVMAPIVPTRPVWYREGIGAQASIA
jgi:hypothetical protein